MPVRQWQKVQRCCLREDRQVRAAPRTVGSIDRLLDSILDGTPDDEREDVLAVVLTANAVITRADVEAMHESISRLGKLLAAGGPLAHVRFPRERFDRVAGDVLTRFDPAALDDDEARSAIATEIGT